MGTSVTGTPGEREERDWQVLGQTDPLWAVLMKPGTKNGGWDPEEFLATGRAEVGGVLEHIAALGLAPGRQTAVDFGCGAGRTAIALSASFDEVIGIDISEGMLATARSLAPEGSGLRFVRAEGPGTGLAAIPDDSVDLVYSSLVIQHMPADLGREALAEMARVLRPGGVVAVQVTTETLRNAKGYMFKYLPWPILRFGQRVVLRYPAPMRMQAVPAETVATAFARYGVQVRDRVEDTSYGGHWRYHRYYGVKPR